MVVVWGCVSGWMRIMHQKSAMMGACRLFNMLWLTSQRTRGGRVDAWGYNFHAKEERKEKKEKGGDGHTHTTRDRV